MSRTDDLASLRRLVDRMREMGGDGSDWAEVVRLLAGFKLDEWKCDKAVRGRDVEALAEIVGELEELERRESRTRGY